MNDLQVVRIHTQVNETGLAMVSASAMPGLMWGGSTAYSLAQCVSDCRRDEAFVRRFNQLTGRCLDSSGQHASAMSAEAEFHRFVYDTVWSMVA